MHTQPTLMLPRGPVLTDLGRALRRLPPAVRRGLMASAVLCALAPGVINAMQTARNDAPLTAIPAVSPATPEPTSPVRCGGCGSVQSIRFVEASGSTPAAYEFTVRMRDGTLRTSSDPSAGKWLVGDRIILVGGVAATAP